MYELTQLKKKRKEKNKQNTIPSPDMVINRLKDK